MTDAGTAGSGGAAEVTGRGAGTDMEGAGGSGAGDDRPVGPAGWHPDPWRRHQRRFFDGWLWTEHVADGGLAGLDSEPVARLDRSRPRPPRAHPPSDPVGARVVGRSDAAAGAAGAEPGDVRDALLLVDERPDADGARWLRTPDDRLAGRVLPRSPAWPVRVGRRLVASPSATITGLVVADAAGVEVLTLARPAARVAPRVDVRGPDGLLGTVVADRVRRGLRAEVRAAAGAVVGTLTQDAGGGGALALAGPDGALRARLTPRWDVPGMRRHLPPGVLLLDRRPMGGDLHGEGEGEVDPATADLLLAAVLSPILLLPPPPPPE